jgi:hypothetical protein
MQPSDHGARQDAALDASLARANYSVLLADKTQAADCPVGDEINQVAGQRSAKLEMSRVWTIREQQARARPRYAGLDR